MIPEYILNRKGPRSLKDLNPEVLTYLNKGLIETKNLMEWLATDQLKLLKLVLIDLEKENWNINFEEAISAQKKPTSNTNTKVIGEVLGALTRESSVYKKLQKHTSDLVRCWSCWAQSMHNDTIEELLPEMKKYAADTHFGVREVVVFATKERIIEDLDNSIDILGKWAASADENIRRFAIEVIRPIGVWTKKIPVFQESPEKAIVILDQLKSDTSKYVRDAVGNWLNDASKSQPDWVKTTCKRWEKESPTKATAYIVRRGMRTINK